MRRALTGVAALAVAVAMCVSTGGAGAAERSDSKVVITKAEADSGETTVRGKVKSSKSSCKNYRKVKVYHDVFPDGPGGDDFLLGVERTNKRGKWKLDTHLAPDRVYAKVTSNSSCKKARSKTKPVDSF